MMREQDLLAAFLIDNEFQDTVSFAQFVRLFPSKYQSHPDLKDLYRTYLASRSHLRAMVRDNIAQHSAQQQMEADQELALEQQKQQQRKYRQQMKKRLQNQLEVGSSLGFDAAAGSGTADGCHANGDDESDYDMDMEGTDKHLTLPQAIDELLMVQGVLESEVARMERECQQYAEDIQKAEKELEGVDIPSAPFKNYQEEELFESLEELIRLCDTITGPEA